MVAKRSAPQMLELLFGVSWIHFSMCIRKLEEFPNVSDDEKDEKQGQSDVVRHENPNKERRGVDVWNGRKHQEREPQNELYESCGELIFPNDLVDVVKDI